MTKIPGLLTLSIPDLSYSGISLLATQTVVVTFTLLYHIPTYRYLDLPGLKNTIAKVPSPGDYTLGIDTRGYPEVFMWTRSIETYRAGVWKGDRFSGSTSVKPSSVYGNKFVFSKDEVNYTYNYDLLLSSTHPRRVVSHTGLMQWWSWAERQTSWVLYSSGPPLDACDNYQICGAYASCNISNDPLCACLDKFAAKSPKDYNAGDWSAGCVRRTPLNCQKGDIFLKYSGLKLPDARNSWFDSTMTLEKCRDMCLGNCSCTAYSSMDFIRGSGCFIWFGELKDIRLLSDGQDIYLRMASSEARTKVEQNETTKAVPKVASDHKSSEKIIVSLTLALGGLLLCLCLTLYVWKRKHTRTSRKGVNRNIFANNSSGENQSKDLSLPMFELEMIREATNNFSISNKLGQGGYGPVYKGVLEGRQEIAVKRLSSCSTQGFKEFNNEVLCIAKLQHRNLVKLLGCCVEGEEKMLVYEYMPNKSLDYYIFDETQSTLLDWPKRFNILNGISRGILYLHQDSRLRIIHRDLKASNVLLDIDMNPKISDFGMARIFGGNETEANTRRVVGTYGYVSPAYQVDGIFSVRSDVFSFGVLVLEIVSGKKNRGFLHPDHNHNLLGHAWILYNEGRSLELIDATIIDSCYKLEMVRSIHVALLCVQQYPEDRPSMSSVVLMLSGDQELPQPKQLGFFTPRKPLGVEFSTSREACSPNGVTISLLYAR